MKRSPPERRTRNAAAVALAVATILASAPTAANAADPSEKLEGVTRALGESRARQEAIERQAAAVADEMKALQARSVAVARKTQDLESSVSAVEGRLDALLGDEDSKARSLGEQRDRLTRLIAAIQRMARHPPVALIALPTAPNDTVRSAILLRTTIPAVRSSANRLRSDLQALNEVRDKIAGERRALSAAEKALAAERDALRALTADKKRVEARLRAEGSAEADRAAALAEEAQSLRELLHRIETRREAEAAREARQRSERERAEREGAARERQRMARLSPPAAPSPPAAAHQEPTLGRSMPLPARGRIARRFGDPTDIGESAKGLTIVTRPAAQVVAPHDGTVVFAGPFRRVGRLLIIEHAGGYHTLLAGFARIDAGVGRKVVAGEPVGVMSPSPKTAPTLYFELRQKGQPINPMPWLAARNSKVRR